MDELVTLGRIVRPHGIAGAVRILPCDMTAADLSEMLPDVVTARPPRRGEQRPLTIQSLRVHKDHVLAEFAEVESMDEAERLRGWTIVIPESERPALEDGAWYADQLVGLTVIDAATGESAGVVRELMSGAAQELLIIETPAGKRLPLPFVESLVGEIDIRGGTLRATILEGLDELGF